MNNYDATIQTIAATYINSTLLRTRSFAYKWGSEPVFKIKWGMFAICIVTCCALINGAAHTEDTAQTLLAQIHQDSVASK